MIRRIRTVEESDLGSVKITYRLEDGVDFFQVTVFGGGVESFSNLKDRFGDRSRFNIGIDALEGLYISLAGSGVDISDPTHVEAFFATVEKLASETVV